MAYLIDASHLLAPITQTTTPRTQGGPFIGFDRRLVSFDVRDTKGRVIGAGITTFAQEFTDLPADPQPTSWSTVPAGFYFCFTPQATRNGLPYGASQNRRRFSTAAERDQAVAEYLADARKRAAKIARGA